MSLGEADRRLLDAITPAIRDLVGSTVRAEVHRLLREEVPRLTGQLLREAITTHVERASLIEALDDAVKREVSRMKEGS